MHTSRSGLYVFFSFIRRSFVFLLPVTMVIIPSLYLIVLFRNFETNTILTCSNAMNARITHQMSVAEGMIDSAALILYEYSSNIHFIDAGLSEAPDNDTIQAMASQELHRAASLSNDIYSMYLVCNLNDTIYNSTDYQIYNAEQFFDRSWTQQYTSASSEITLLDVPRPVSTPYRQTLQLISLVSRVPNMSTLKNKYLICNIDLNTLGERLLRDVQSENQVSNDTILLLYNRRGDLLYTSNAALASADFQKEYFSDSAGESGSVHRKIQLGSQTYLAVTAHSQSDGWNYMHLLPYEHVIRQRNLLLREAILPYGIYYVLLCLLVLLLWYIFRSFTEKRIRSLAFTTAVPRLDGESSLEYSSRLAVSEHQKRQETLELMEQARPVLTEYAIKSLLYNETANASMHEFCVSVMKQLQILDMQGRIYTVMLSQVEAISALKLQLQRDSYNQLRHTIEFGCSEQLPENWIAYYVWQDYSQLCCLLSLPADLPEQELQPQMTTAGRNVRNHIALLSRQPATVSFGDLVKTKEEISVSYEHARQLLQYKIYHQTDMPYTYRSFLEEEMEMKYDQQKYLIDQIRLGKGDKAARILGSYFSLLHDNPEADLSFVKLSARKLTEAISGALDGQKYPKAEKEASLQSVLEAIESATTVHEAADATTAFAIKCADHMQSLNENKQAARVQEALDWINNNYNRDISLADVAEQLNLSPAYTSRMIKETTGASFVAYVNQIRITHAMELLATTDLNTSEIATATGFRYPQNFIRNFNKIAGMTPGSYRTLNHGKSGTGSPV